MAQRIATGFGHENDVGARGQERFRAGDRHRGRGTAVQRAALARRSDGHPVVEHERRHPGAKLRQSTGQYAATAP